MSIHDDDDLVSIPRADLINLRSALAQIEEAGGLVKIKAVVELINQPGVHDAIMTMVAHRESEKWMAKFQLNREILRARRWKFLAWLAAIAIGLTSFISSFDGAVTAIRGWFKS